MSHKAQELAAELDSAPKAEPVNQRLLDALTSLCFELPNILPSSAVARLEKTGKMIEMPQYDVRGHTGTIRYRADDMQAVFAAYDQASAAITEAEQAQGTSHDRP